MKYYFTSDFHLGHTKIIEYCKRPFNTIEEMNETIIKNYNSIVKPEDIVFHIGDFHFKNSEDKITSEQFEKRLNGKIIFIKGNHDHSSSSTIIIENMVIKHGGKDIFLTHNPEDWDCTFKLNLVGHVHDEWKSKIVNGHGLETLLINVGVDVWNFKPVSIEEILKEYEKSAMSKERNMQNFIGDFL